MDLSRNQSKDAQGYDTIGDRLTELTKSAIFTPMRETDPLDKLARLYLKEVVTRHGNTLANHLRSDPRLATNFLEVSPWERGCTFWQTGEVEPRVHKTYHVSNLKKCHADEPLAVPLDGLNLDDKLHFVEEPVEIVDREVKRLKRSRIPLVKVRWNSKRGPEYTWEREDQFKKKYPQLFTKTTPSSSVAL
ncbi:hypothetical protein Tco_0155254 [Tanacetum coccineum]